jgi:glycosyltransferase involved in cell wall biosynthesis
VKIGIYNEPNGGSAGGSEVLVARLAAGLARAHDVELIHHRALMTRASLEALSGEPLGEARLRHVTPEPNPFLSNGASWRAQRQRRAWHRCLSEPYDLFINSTHGIPPFCRAPRGVLLVLFPLFNPFDAWPWTPDATDTRGRVWKRVRRGLYDWEWRKRLDTYQTKLAISAFTQLWTNRRWGVDCEIVYPPVDSTFTAVEKHNTIISVGRFVARGVVKNQLEMMQAYRGLDGRAPEDCTYCCVGGIGGSVEDQTYVETIRRLAGAGRRGARVLVNAPRPELLSTYERAKVFWHATGYGTDDTTHPQLAEHFGIVTVEAMAAGCVPVVINRGAQPEIIQHGVNGFLWDTLDELQSYTLQLLRDDSLRERMAAAARERARFFSGKRFLEHFDSIVNALA